MVIIWEESGDWFFSFTQNQEGIHISELDLLTIGEINDMYVEMQRDEEPHEMLACQDDMDKWIVSK